MAAFMVVSMDILDKAWIAPYFAAVPTILADHGGVSVAGSRDIRAIEGDSPAPERMAVFTFPTLDAIDRFFEDPRYRPFREMRMASAKTRIFAFENAVTQRELV